MKKIDGQTVVLEKNADKIFEVLSDFRNFEQFLPEKVENWNIEGSVCSFSIASIGTISVEMSTNKEAKTILYSSVKSPVNFSLEFCLTPLNENRTQIEISVCSDANAMVLMMLKHPLRNFMQLIAEKAQEVSNQLIA